MVLVRLALASFLIVFPALNATALVAEPQPLNTPVPEQWRAPLTKFLNELGAKDISSTIDASKARPYPQNFGEGGPSRIVFRIVHPTSCSSERNECLTIIGHIDDGILISDALFFAGDMIGVGDMSPRILGAQLSKPVWFISKSSVVNAIKTQKGLMITAEPLKPSK